MDIKPLPTLPPAAVPLLMAAVTPVGLLVAVPSIDLLVTVTPVVPLLPNVLAKKLLTVIVYERLPEVTMIEPSYAVLLVVLMSLNSMLELKSVKPLVASASKASLKLLT